jgi:hypothetical protein
MYVGVPCPPFFSWGYSVYAHGRRQHRCADARALGAASDITAGPITKLFAWGGEDSGGHVL